MLTVKYSDWSRWDWRKVLLVHDVPIRISWVTINILFKISIQKGEKNSQFSLCHIYLIPCLSFLIHSSKSRVFSSSSSSSKSSPVKRFSSTGTASITPFSNSPSPSLSSSKSFRSLLFISPPEASLNLLSENKNNSYTLFRVTSFSVTNSQSY